MELQEIENKSLPHDFSVLEEKEGWKQGIRAKAQAEAEKLLNEIKAGERRICDVHKLFLLRFCHVFLPSFFQSSENISEQSLRRML